MRRWPRYQSHSNVSCSNCQQDIGIGGWWFHAETIAPGNGQYVQTCEQCRTDTYYDLQTEACND